MYGRLWQRTAYVQVLHPVHLPAARCLGWRPASVTTSAEHIPRFMKLHRCNAQACLQPAASVHVVTCPTVMHSLCVHTYRLGSGCGHAHVIFPVHLSKTVASGAVRGFSAVHRQATARYISSVHQPNVCRLVALLLSKTLYVVIDCWAAVSAGEGKMPSPPPDSQGDQISDFYDYLPSVGWNAFFMAAFYVLTLALAWRVVRQRTYGPSY